MASFHTLYIYSVLASPDEDGSDIPAGLLPRIGRAFHSRWLGRIGETQVLPTYLGLTGMASLLCGFIAIEIIGLNMWASVDWDLLRFIKLLPFLSLEPPPQKYGLHLPPLADGGCWLMAGSSRPGAGLSAGTQLAGCAAGRGAETNAGACWGAAAMRSGPILLSLALVAATAFVLFVPDWQRPSTPVEIGYRAMAMDDFPNTARREGAMDSPPAVPTVPDDPRPATEVYQNIQVLTGLDAGSFLRLQHAITAWVAPQQGCGFCNAGSESPPRTTRASRRRGPCFGWCAR